MDCKTTGTLTGRNALQIPNDCILAWRQARRRMEELVPPSGSELYLQARHFAPQCFELGVCGLDLEQNFCARPTATRGLLTRHFCMRVTLSRSRGVPSLDEFLLLLAPGLSLIHVRLSTDPRQEHSSIVASVMIGKRNPKRRVQRRGALARVVSSRRGGSRRRRTLLRTSRTVRHIKRF